MQTYNITKMNKDAIYGRIKKFWKSCAKKNHCYKVNGKLIFPFLTDEQIRDAQIFAPIRSTCKSNGLHHGDVVRFYGGNRIIVLGKHDKTEFIRVVPKEDITKTISGCITSTKHLLPPEFMFNRLVMSSTKKRYTTSIPIKEAAITRSSQELREHPPIVPEGFNFASSYEVPQYQPNPNVPVVKYEDLPDGLKPFFWDGKESIARLSDVGGMISKDSSTSEMLEKVITGYIREDLSDAENWGTDGNGFPVILDSLPGLSVSNKKGGNS